MGGIRQHLVLGGSAFTFVYKIMSSCDFYVGGFQTRPLAEYKNPGKQS